MIILLLIYDLTDIARQKAYIYYNNAYRDETVYGYVPVNNVGEILGVEGGYDRYCCPR